MCADGFGMHWLQFTSPGYLLRKMATIHDQLTSANRSTSARYDVSLLCTIVIHSLAFKCHKCHMMQCGLETPRIVLPLSRLQKRYLNVYRFARTTPTSKASSVRWEGLADETETLNRLPTMAAVSIENMANS